MDANFHIGWCPFCDQGWINIVNDSTQNTLLLLCDECDTIWNKPEDIQSNKPMTTYKPSAKLETPSLGQVQRVGWDKLLVTINDI